MAELTLEPRFLLALQPPQYYNVNFVELSNLARGPQLTVLPNHFDDDATVAHGLGQFEPADAKLLKPLLVVERLAPTVLSPCRVSLLVLCLMNFLDFCRFPYLDLESDWDLESRDPRHPLRIVALAVPLIVLPAQMLFLAGVA